jgi:O-phosphoseryl-tRNA(Sec) kinase
MANALEPPDRHKRSWEDATVVTSTMGKALEEDADGSTDAVSSMWSSVWRAWGTAPPPPMTAQERTAVRDAGRAANATSSIHALDLRSRRALGECVRRCDGAARADASAALNAARKEMLDAAREKTAGPRGGVTSEGGDETDAVLDEDALELAAFVMQREDAFAQLCEDFAPVAVDAGDDGT